MISRLIGRVFSAARDGLARVLIRMGVSANALTVTGLLPTVVAGYFIARGSFVWAVLFIVISGAFDMLDGAVARLSGRMTAFGGVLDSSLDRYADIVLFGALSWYFYDVRAQRALALVTLAALAGALLVSYTRARAENVIEKCRGGFWARGERIVYMTIGMVTGGLPVVVCVMAVGTHWTAIGRILYTRRMCMNPPREIGPKDHLAKFFYWTYARGTLAYDIAVCILTAATIAYGRLHAAGVIQWPQ